MRNIFSIADVAVAVDGPWELTGNERFRPFQSDVEPSTVAEFIPVDVLPETNGPLLWKTEKLDVVSGDEKLPIVRYFDRLLPGEPYAVRIAYPEAVKVFYLRPWEGNVNHVDGALFHVGMEGILLAHGGVILHASCVGTPLGGILFSGPSGVGKSTQAELWCRFADGTLINGDRAIIRNPGTGLRAYGSPYAGSSGCYRNESVPIRAIVMLRQGLDCDIQRLSIQEAARELLPQITMNLWDLSFVEQVGTLVSALLSDIPVYRLSCTADQTAVELLRNTLIREGEPTWQAQSH